LIFFDAFSANFKNKLVQYDFFARSSKGWTSWIILNHTESIVLRGLLSDSITSQWPTHTNKIAHTLQHKCWKQKWHDECQNLLHLNILLSKMHFSHIFVWGFCFWFCIPGLLRLRLLLPPPASTHTLTHNYLSHTITSHTITSHTQT
jgi:hypothetical protein